MRAQFHVQSHVSLMLGPVTALMINADFRIVDPCAGHDCCLGACQPQLTAATYATSVSERQSPANTPQASRSSSHAQNAMERTPPTDDATTAASAQQSSARTAPESRSPHAVRPVKKVIAKATYDANGYIQWLSQKYTG